MRKPTLSDTLIGLGIMLVSMVIDAVLYLIPTLAILGLLSFTNLAFTTKLLFACLGAGLLMGLLETWDDFRRWHRKLKPPRRNQGAITPSK